MTDPVKEKRFSRSLLVNAACLVLLIVGLALVSNRLLDIRGIATERGLSIGERKEKAHRNQENYDKPQSTKTETKRWSWLPRINVLKWFSGPGADEICADDEIVDTARQLINDQTLNLGEMASALRQLEVLRLEGAEAAKSKKIPEELRAENQIIVVGEPFPISHDPDLKRTQCRLSYTVKGLGYNADQERVATYTAQPGKRDWIVTLVSLE